MLLRIKKDTTQVTSKWIGGMCFVGTTTNGHSVVVKDAAAEDEVKRGPSSMEMLLLDVADCPSIGMVMTTEKQRQKITDRRAEVTAKRTDIAPCVFTEIHIRLKVYDRGL